MQGIFLKKEESREVGADSDPASNYSHPRARAILAASDAL